MTDTDQVSYVAAALGFEVLTYLPDDRAFDSRPVIAWAILRDDEGCVRARPIVYSESMSLDYDRPVCLPSGEVVYGDLEWASVDEWLAEMKSNEGHPIALGKPARGGVLALDAFRHKLQGA